MTIFISTFISSHNVDGLTFDELINQRNVSGEPQIKVGDSPTSIAVNPNTNKIYVANAYSNTVSVIVEILKKELQISQ
jgi:DNA-binding beta-propeller fold protein YncE